ETVVVLVVVGSGSPVVIATATLNTSSESKHPPSSDALTSRTPATTPDRTRPPLDLSFTPRRYQLAVDNPRAAAPPHRRPPRDRAGAAAREATPRPNGGREPRKAGQAPRRPEHRLGCRRAAGGQ